LARAAVLALLLFRLPVLVSLLAFLTPVNPPAINSGPAADETRDHDGVVA
jgi:hypothetical protein